MTDALSDSPRTRHGALHGAGGPYSTSQVARILGVAEASVKRLADSGAIACTRLSANTKRSFTGQQIVNHLRAGRASPSQGLAEALRALDKDEFVAQVIDVLGRGGHLEDVLDETLGRAGTEVEGVFAGELLLRLAALLAHGRDSGRPALVARVGDAATEARMVECVLRSLGFDALSASESVSADELGRMVVRVGAELAIFVLPRNPAAPHGGVLEAARDLAAQLGPGCVCIVGSADLPAPPGVTLLTSMVELGRFLRHS